MPTSPEGTIAAEHVWKRFRADPSQARLRARVKGAAQVLRGRRRGWRWALRDIELRAEPGESVGLVGINGSGKSTLLKILTRVMYPYAGRVEVAGRVGALIEVRAGIHPELSGRENIHLYGTLLGLARRDVAARFDEIVEFAQLESAVDRQVKHYSSGMQMRLGFAVAAFLQPDVLLVDEVLAVGDTSFQQRCIDRMRAVLAEGTTLVFVSHDLAAVEGVCRRSVWLHDGVVEADGSTREVLGAYRGALEASAALEPLTSGIVQVQKATVRGPGGDAARSQEPLEISLVLRSHAQYAGRLCLGISEGPASPVILVRRDLTLRDGDISVRCRIERLPLPRGRMFLWVGVFRAGGDLLGWHPVSSFDVLGPDLDQGPPGIVRLAPVHVVTHWDVEDR